MGCARAALLQEQEKKAKIRGVEAQKQNIAAARSVSRTLLSSLGPKGADKMLQNSDGEVTISALLCSFCDPSMIHRERRIGKPGLFARTCYC